MPWQCNACRVSYLQWATNNISIVIFLHSRYIIKITSVLFYTNLNGNVFFLTLISYTKRQGRVTSSFQRVGFFWDYNFVAVEERIEEACLDGALIVIKINIKCHHSQMLMLATMSQIFIFDVGVCIRCYQKHSSVVQRLMNAKLLWTTLNGNIRCSVSHWSGLFGLVSLTYRHQHNGQVQQKARGYLTILKVTLKLQATF